MTVREILKMGDPRLLLQAEPVTAFGTAELDALISDMFETMHAAGMIPATIAGEVVTSCAEWHRMNWRQFVQT